MDYEHPLVEVRESSHHGRGLFVRRDVPAGQILLVSPLLILSPEDSAVINTTRLGNYVFWVDEVVEGQPRLAVGFGPISMCNHASEPNCLFTVSTETRDVTLRSAVPLSAGTEILIDYEEYQDFSTVKD